MHSCSAFCGSLAVLEGELSGAIIEMRMIMLLELLQHIYIICFVQIYLCMHVCVHKYVHLNVQLSFPHVLFCKMVCAGVHEAYMLSRVCAHVYENVGKCFM